MKGIVNEMQIGDATFVRDRRVTGAELGGLIVGGTMGAIWLVGVFVDIYQNNMAEMKESGCVWRSFVQDDCLEGRLYQEEWYFWAWPSGKYHLCCRGRKIISGSIETALTRDLIRSIDEQVFNCRVLKVGNIETPCGYASCVGNREDPSKAYDLNITIAGDNCELLSWEERVPCNDRTTACPEAFTFQATGILRYSEGHIRVTNPPTMNHKYSLILK